MGEKATSLEDLTKELLRDIRKVSPNDQNTADDVYYEQLEKLKALLGDNETSLWLNYKHVMQDPEAEYAPLSHMAEQMPDGSIQNSRIVGYYDYLEYIRQNVGEDGVKAALAHELGHWYDAHHPKQRYPFLDSYRLNDLQRDELRADFIGACFTGDPQAFIQLYKEMEQTEVIPVSADGKEQHLRMAVRMDMIGKLKPSNCPVDLRSQPMLAQREPAAPSMPPTLPPQSKPEWQCTPPGLPGDIYEMGACQYLPSGSSASRSPGR